MVDQAQAAYDVGDEIKAAWLLCQANAETNCQVAIPSRMAHAIVASLASASEETLLQSIRTCKFVSLLVGSWALMAMGQLERASALCANLWTLLDMHETDFQAEVDSWQHDSRISLRFALATIAAKVCKLLYRQAIETSMPAGDFLRQMLSAAQVQVLARPESGAGYSTCGWVMAKTSGYKEAASWYRHAIQVRQRFASRGSASKQN